MCRANFLGTKSLLQLAGDMDHLQTFVHVSTYYVNNFKPFNTPVTEKVHYPTLQLAGEQQHHVGDCHTKQEHPQWPLCVCISSTAAP
jgi:nucleoside-diphosphate-sugar epimerase